MRYVLFVDRWVDEDVETTTTDPETGETITMRYHRETGPSGGRDWQGVWHHEGRVYRLQEVDGLQSRQLIPAPNLGLWECWCDDACAVYLDETAVDVIVSEEVPSAESHP